MADFNFKFISKKVDKPVKSVGGIYTGKPGRPKGCKLTNKVNRTNSNQARFGHRSSTTSKNKDKETPLKHGFHTEDYHRLCVYAHYYDNENYPFYIGSGTIGRAFSFDNSRTPQYKEKVKDVNLIRVEILEIDLDKESSIEIESKYIKKYGLKENGGTLINSCEKNCGGSKIGNARSIPVIQLTKRGEFIKEWISANHAATELKIDSSCIIKVCKHVPKYNSAGGYKWMYKSEYDNLRN